MQRKLLISASFSALLLVGACDNLMRTGLGCNTIRHNIQGTSGDTVRTATGLRYIDVQLGTGPAAESCRNATVRYAGSLLGGAEFDQNTIAVVPGTGQLISGFEQGVIGMNVGGIRRVIVPPDLGYGSTPRTNLQGQVVIPANSTLVFDLELLATN